MTKKYEIGDVYEPRSILRRHPIHNCEAHCLQKIEKLPCKTDPEYCPLTLDMVKVLVDLTTSYIYRLQELESNNTPFHDKIKLKLYKDWVDDLFNQNSDFLETTKKLIRKYSQCKQELLKVKTELLQARMQTNSKFPHAKSEELVKLKLKLRNTAIATKEIYEHDKAMKDTLMEKMTRIKNGLRYLHPLMQQPDTKVQRDSDDHKELTQVLKELCKDLSTVKDSVIEYTKLHRHAKDKRKILVNMKQEYDSMKQEVSHSRRSTSNPIPCKSETPGRYVHVEPLRNSVEYQLQHILNMVKSLFCQYE